MPAPAISNRTSAYGAPSAGTRSFSVTRAAGESLFICVHAVYGGGTADAISSIVWDAAGDNQAFALKLASQPSGYANFRYAVYELIAPTSVKTGTVLVTYAGSNNTKSIESVAHVTNATSATVTVVENQVYQSDTPMSNSISSATGRLVLDFLCVNSLAATVAVASGQGDVVIQGYMGTDTPTIATSTKAGASSVTMGWTTTAGQTNHNVHFLLDIPAAGGGPTSVSSDLAAAYAISQTINSSLAVAYGVIAQINADLTASYTLMSANSVSSDLAAAYAISATINADFAATYNTLASISKDLAAAYAVASAGLFVSEQFIYNTETLWAPGQSMAWTWTVAGRPGSMTGKTIVDGVSVLDSDYRLHLSGLPVGAGKLDVAVLGATPDQDALYAQYGTVA